MDEIDLVLSEMLLINSRTSYRVLAERLGLSVNAVHKRIQSMIDENVIRGFTAKPSLRAMGALQVIIHGSSEARSIPETMRQMGSNDSVYWVAAAGGNYLYVGSYVRGLGSLQSVASAVADAGEMREPRVGILDQGYDPSTPLRETLEPLDWEIIYQLRGDSKRPIVEVAKAVGVSAKTARRRLDRMTRHQLVELSIEWYPDASNDIISVFHVHTKPKVKLNIMETYRMYAPRLVFLMSFQNLPREYLLLTWSRAMQDMLELYSRFEADERFGSVSTNIMYTGKIYPTWRDRLLEKQGKSSGIGAAAGPAHLPIYPPMG